MRSRSDCFGSGPLRARNGHWLGAEKRTPTPHHCWGLLPIQISDSLPRATQSDLMNGVR